MSQILKNYLLILVAFLLITNTSTVSSGGLDVNITNEISFIDVEHNGKEVRIQRNQSLDNLVNTEYAKTSRKCPPFCIQPYNLGNGVETIGELELLNYLKKSSSGDNSILIIDSRTKDWAKKGTIPGSINIPWTLLKPEAGADPFEVAELLEKKFGAINIEGLWNFSNAKTLVLFCNGMWCGQSPSSIKTLLRFGYPAEKLKWYRGGMQDWEILGLTVVK
tara:strand:- start:9700 stop:10359 length:660 start_codon:yes stop_codon:yes gene_type:complete